MPDGGRFLYHNLIGESGCMLDGKKKKKDCLLLQKQYSSTSSLHCIPSYFVARLWKKKFNRVVVVFLLSFISFLNLRRASVSVRFVERACRRYNISSSFLN